jgi:hypothetical protein
MCENELATFAEAGKGGRRLVEMIWQPVRRLVEEDRGGRRWTEMCGNEVEVDRGG